MTQRTTKSTNDICGQRRIRSVRASAQSDESSLALSELLKTKLFFVRTAKTLIRLGVWFIGFVMVWLKYLFSTYSEFHACWFSFCNCQTYKSNCKKSGQSEANDILEAQFKWNYLLNDEPDYFFTNFLGKIIFWIPFCANLFTFTCISKTMKKKKTVF